MDIKTLIIIIMVIYFSGMVVISWFGRKYSEGLTSYLNAGKSAGILLIMGGLVGGQVGNGVVVGGAGEGAAIGISGAWYGIGCGIAIIMVGLVMNRYIYRSGLMSLAEFFQQRYDNRVPGLIYDIASAVMYVGVIASQLMAGKALFEAIGLNGTVGVIVIALIVVVYSQIAGLWGSMATSVVQVTIILAALFICGGILLSQGALTEINAAVAAGQVPETYTKMSGAYTPAATMMLVIPSVLSFITDCSCYERINSATSERKSFWAHILSGLCIFAIVLIPAFIGMTGRVRFGAEGNEAFFRVILETLPPVAAALVITAVVAAVMSTIDSTYICASQVLLSDLYMNWINPKADYEKVVKKTIYVNAGISVLAVLLALVNSSIVGLISNAYMFLCASCMVPFAGGVLWKKATPAGAIAGAAVGFVTAALEFTGIAALPYAAVTDFLPSLVAFVAVSLLTQKKESTEAAE